LTNLPAHLQKYQSRDIGQTLSQTLGSAMPPHVSIAGGRFTLVDASNAELPGAWFDQKLGVYLDACIVDVNEHLSRVYFAGAYDPNAEGVRPDCFSDNGVGPSISANSPQAASCTPDPDGVFGCKWAVWGSKISPNGKKIPACSQKQKIALIVPGYDVLFLLAVPPNSHGLLREYTNLCKGNGINMADVITRIYFKAGELGTLMFQGINYIDEPTAVMRQKAWDQKATDSLVGRNDVARPALPPPQGYGATSAALIQQVIPTNQPPFNPAPAAAGPGPMPMTQTIAAQPAGQQVQQPGPFGDVSTVASQSTNTVTPSNNAGPVPGVSTTSPSEPARRRRRTAAEMQAAQQPPAGQPANGAAPQAPFPHPGQQTPLADFGISQGQPAAANSELAGMLDDFFGKG
jgi:hypothetical protein